MLVLIPIPLVLVFNSVYWIMFFISEYSLQNENKHHIMNVHTKWNWFYFNCIFDLEILLCRYWISFLPISKALIFDDWKCWRIYYKAYLSWFQIWVVLDFSWWTLHNIRVKSYFLFSWLWFSWWSKEWIFDKLHWHNEWFGGILWL